MTDIDDMRVEMDSADLWSEEIVTDRKQGLIRVLTPLTPEGLKDLSRKPVFSGEVQIMTQMGPLPVTFEIKADSLAEAVKIYGIAAREGVRQTIEKLQELRREAASKIVTPGSPGFGVPPSAGGGIQLP